MNNYYSYNLFSNEMFNIPSHATELIIHCGYHGPMHHCRSMTITCPSHITKVKYNACEICNAHIKVILSSTVRALHLDKSNNFALDELSNITSISYGGDYGRTHPTPTIPQNIEHLKFDPFSGNMSIILPQHLKSVSFGWYYNQMTILPPYTTSVEFGHDYNTPTSFPDSIEHIEFGTLYNQTTILPKNLKSVKFGKAYDQPTIFPEDMECLKFEWDSRYHQTTILPPHLKYLMFGPMFNEVVNLPNNLESVHFGYHYNQMTILPPHIKNVSFGHMYNQITILPPHIEYLYFRANFNQQLILPASIIELNIVQSDFNHVLDIEHCHSLTTLNLTKTLFNQHLIFPQHIRRIMFGNGYNQPTTFPASVREIYFGSDYNQLTIFPENLMYLHIGEHYNQPTIFPSSLGGLSISVLSDHLKQDLGQLFSNYNLTYVSYYPRDEQYMLPLVKHINNNSHNIIVKNKTLLGIICAS